MLGAFLGLPEFGDLWPAPLNCYGILVRTALVCRRFEFCMSKAPRPDVTASTERLQVMASYARIRLAFGAPILVALSGVKSTAYRVLPLFCMYSVKYYTLLNA